MMEKIKPQKNLNLKYPRPIENTLRLKVKQNKNCDVNLSIKKPEHLHLKNHSAD